MDTEQESSDDKSGLDIENTTPGEEEIVTVREGELETFAKEKPLHTVVRVVERAFQPYILLEDNEGNKNWGPLYNNDKEYTINLNENFKRSQRIYREHTPTPDELNKIREVLTAIGIIGNFFGYDEGIVGQMIDHLIVKSSHEIFCRITGSKATIDELKDNKDFADYINMVACLIQSFLNLKKDVMESVEQAMSEASKETGVQNNTGS